MNKENKNFMIFFKISNFSERRVTGKNWSADQIDLNSATFLRSTTF